MSPKMFRRGSTPAITALALALTIGATAAEAHTTRHHHKATHHAKSHARHATRSHTHRVAARHVANVPPNAGAACVNGGNPTNGEQTVNALRFNENAAQLDTTFRCLAKYSNPMPGWGVQAKGWVRLAAPGGPFDQLLMQLMMNVWQGKVWYTHTDGGSIYNRMFDDRETWHHTVNYAPTSILDDRPTIFVNAAPVPGVDNIRMVQPGIYLGTTMTDGVQPIWGPDSTWTVPRGIARGYFILDFNNTKITKTECPLCTPNAQNADPVPLPTAPAG
jgi:hypothetical protein